MDMVVFDIDGTLTDTEYVAELAWNAVKSDLNLAIPDELRRSVVGTAKAQAESILAGFFADRAAYEMFQSRTDAWFFSWLKENGLPLKAQAVASIRRLKKVGLRCAFATSSDCKKIGIYSALCPELFALPELVVTGDQVTCGKPDPAIYRRVLRLAGLPGSRCLAVEDSPAGIASACGAGIQVIGVEDRISLAGKPGKACLRRFAALEEACFYIQSIKRGAFETG